MIFKFEKMQKKENKWKIKKQNFKTKKNGSKIKGEKKESQKGKNMGKAWTCPFAFLRKPAVKHGEVGHCENRGLGGGRLQTDKFDAFPHLIRVASVVDFAAHVPGGNWVTVGFDSPWSIL